jgi:hypothetical protein
MRSVRALLALWFVVVVPACEVQPLLGRCENSLDCDRSTTPTVKCVQFANPGIECNGSNGATADCICCPDSLASVTDDTIRQRCSAPIATDSGMQPDTGTGDGQTDASDAMADAVSMGCNPPACMPGLTFCDNNACVPLRSLGTACTSDTQCQLGHCSPEMVCCNVACMASGYSCTIAGLEGLCTALPMDGGTGSDVQMQTDSSQPDAGGSDAQSMDAATE